MRNTRPIIFVLLLMLLTTMVPLSAVAAGDNAAKKDPLTIFSMDEKALFRIGDKRSEVESALGQAKDFDSFVMPFVSEDGRVIPGSISSVMEQKLAPKVQYTGGITVGYDISGMEGCATFPENIAMPNEADFATRKEYYAALAERDNRIKADPEAQNALLEYYNALANFYMNESTVLAVEITGSRFMTYDGSHVGQKQAGSMLAGTTFYPNERRCFFEVNGVATQLEYSYVLDHVSSEDAGDYFDLYKLYYMEVHIERNKEYVDFIKLSHYEMRYW